MRFPKQLVVPKSDYPVPGRCEELGSFLIVLTLCLVMGPVQFDDEPLLPTDEVSDVRADRRLAAECVTLKLTVAKLLPQPPFSIG